MKRIGTRIEMTAVCAISDGALTIIVVTVYGRPKT